MKRIGNYQKVVLIGIAREGKQPISIKKGYSKQVKSLQKRHLIYQSKGFFKLTNSGKRRVHNKGQLSIANIMNWVILVILGGVMTLVLSPIIIDITAQENNTLNKTIIYACIPFMWIGILLTLMLYAQPQAPLRPY